LLKEKLDIPILTIEDLESKPISVDEYFSGEVSETLLVENEKLLAYFNERLDNLPQLISLITYKAKKDGFKRYYNGY